MKDTLVVTGNDVGPETIPFIKGWVMFPGAILMTYIFTKLSNRFSRETVFYIIFSLFLGFFFVFGAILYPMRDSIHLEGFANMLQSGLPIGFRGFTSMIRDWSFTIFYAMSELWGNIILSVLFWGFANQAISLKESKRFYGVLGVGSNFSGIIAGAVSYWLSGHVFDPSLPFGTDAWEQTQLMLLGLVIASGLATLYILRWMYKNHAIETSEPTEVKKGKQKLGFFEGLAFTWKSRYLLCVAVIVVVYNIVINLTEVLWKYEVNALYPDPNEYSQYMNQITAIIGLIATLCSLFVSSNGIRLKGWVWTAMITPIVLLVGSVLFFGSYFVTQFISAGSSQLLPLVVLFGSFQNIASRGAKYSVFDTTKEMAFVPLDSEVKLKGKAAIDGIGSRLGKSGGSFLQQGLFIAFGGLVASTPYIALLILGMIAIWIAAVKALGLQFNALTGQDQAPLKPAIILQD